MGVQKLRHLRPWKARGRSNTRTQRGQWYGQGVLTATLGEHLTHQGWCGQGPKTQIPLNLPSLNLLVPLSRSCFGFFSDWFHLDTFWSCWVAHLCALLHAQEMKLHFQANTNSYTDVWYTTQRQNVLKVKPTKNILKLIGSLQDASYILDMQTHWWFDHETRWKTSRRWLLEEESFSPRYWEIRRRHHSAELTGESNGKKSCCCHLYMLPPRVPEQGAEGEQWIWRDRENIAASLPIQC